MANVDPSLVSRVLNNDSSVRVSDATRRRILESAASLNYERNFVARGVRTNRTYTIGAALPAITSPLFTDLVDAIQAEAATHGYVVVLGGTATPLAGDNSLIRLMRERRVDGLLVTTGSVLDDASIQALDAEGEPVVVVNASVDQVDACATVDDHAASAMATQHLLSLGHRRILHLAGPTRHDPASRRLAGFTAAMATAGAVGDFIELERWDANSGWRALIEEKALVDYTAIVVANSFAAIGALAAARELGRRVPNDLSIIAIHDHPLARYTAPPLSLVSLPMHELGVEAVRLLLRRIAGEAIEPIRVRTPPELHVRESTGRAREV
jgi:LacI family transcriptional regulator